MEQFTQQLKELLQNILGEDYKYYECGQLETIADNIISNLQTQEKPVVPEDIVSDYRNFDSVKDRIFFKLINKDLNKEYLTDKSFIEYLDMAIEFYIMVVLVMTMLNNVISIVAIVTNKHK